MLSAASGSIQRLVQPHPALFYTPRCCSWMYTCGIHLACFCTELYWLLVLPLLHTLAGAAGTWLGILT